MRNLLIVAFGVILCSCEQNVTTENQKNYPETLNAVFEKHGSAMLIKK